MLLNVSRAGTQALCLSSWAEPGTRYVCAERTLLQMLASDPSLPNTQAGLTALAQHCPMQHWS